MERSAEFLRDGLSAIVKWHGGDATGCNPQLLLDRITSLLAAAEAREAGERCHTWGLKSELLPHPVCLVCGALAGDGVNNSPCAQPTSAEVIAAAEKALASNVKLMQSEWFISDCPTNESPGLEFDLSNAALASIARWKEANGGTTAR